MQVHAVFVGVDVAKATLSWSIHAGPGRHDLNHDEASIVGWLTTIPKHDRAPLMEGDHLLPHDRRAPFTIAATLMLFDTPTVPFGELNGRRIGVLAR
jgi:surfactin synthase thioesterase subunit